MTSAYLLQLPSLASSSHILTYKTCSLCGMAQAVRPGGAEWAWRHSAPSISHDRRPQTASPRSSGDSNHLTRRSAESSFPSANRVFLMSRRWSMADPAQLLLAFARGNLVAKMPQASRVVEMCREGRCYTTCPTYTATAASCLHTWGNGCGLRGRLRVCNSLMGRVMQGRSSVGGGYKVAAVCGWCAAYLDGECDYTCNYGFVLKGRES